MDTRCQWNGRRSSCKYIQWAHFARAHGKHGKHGDPHSHFERVHPLFSVYNRELGHVSPSFATIQHVVSIDWIRIHQSKDAIHISCDPSDFPTPTAVYIDEYATGDGHRRAQMRGLAF